MIVARGGGKMELNDSLRLKKEEIGSWDRELGALRFELTSAMGEIITYGLWVDSLEA